MRDHRTRASRMAAGTLALLLLVACSSDRDTTGNASGTSTSGSPATATPGSGDRSDRKGDWTVLAYVNGDNNLEQDALDDIEQMTKAEATRFIVLVDRSDSYSSEPLGDLGEFTDTRLLRIEDGEVSVIDKPGELNMGDPSTLRTFVASGLKHYGRSHNALVVWDHGGAWNGAAWDDSSGGDNLTLAELDEAIGEALQGRDPAKLDLIGFDACLMSTYEVASALRAHTNYILASEEVEPGGGWDWSSLSTEGGSTTRSLAESVAKAFTRESADAGAEDSTLSLLDLRHLDDLDKALMSLAKALKKTNARLAPGRIGAGRSAALSFGRDPDPANDYFQVDLGDLISQLTPIRGLGDAVSEVRRALSKVVVLKHNGPVTANAAGLSAYFPPTVDLVRAAYDDVPEIGPWRTVLVTYFKMVDAVPDEAMPAWTDPDRLLEETDDVSESAEGVSISGEVTQGTGGNITDATIAWGEVDLATATNVIYFGDRNATVNKNKVTGTYDWNRLMISDGSTTTAAYSSLTYDPRGNLAKIIIPIVYQRGNEQADGTLQLGLRDGKVIAETFYLRIGEGVAAVPPAEGDTFIPVLRHQNLDDESEQWIAASSQPLSADRDKLDFSYGRLPAARAILLSLAISDLRGESDFIYSGTATPG